MTVVILLLVAVAAAARGTRLVVDDKITEPIRQGAARRLKQPTFDDHGRQVAEGSKLTYLLHCTWCAGLWVSAIVAALAWWGGLATLMPEVPWWAGWPLLVGALGWTTGILKHLDSE